MMRDDIEILADPLDHAQALSERERADLCKVRRPELTRTGRCWFCNAKLPGGPGVELYCDPDCEEDGARQDRQRAIRGR